MSKKEIIFPYNTMGGKIQKLRKQNGLSRNQLYDLVFGDTATSDDGKIRTVRNWESGETEPDFEGVCVMCKVLGCSSDYLLGLNECTTKNTQFIHEETGLSEQAISVLAKWKSIGDLPGSDYAWARNSTKAISDLLEQDTWFSRDVLNPIAEYICLRHQYDTAPNKKSLDKYRLALFNASNGLSDCMKAIYEKSTKAPSTK